MSKCDQCDSVTIQGVYTHELGCPNSYKETLVECKWCGQLFEGAMLNQDFCGEDCSDSYYN